MLEKTVRDEFDLHNIPCQIKEGNSGYYIPRNFVAYIDNMVRILSSAVL
jgi:hypothetical protein